MNKRGISALIAVVLLIVITVAVIGVVWQVIIPLIKTSTETTEKCQAASLEINIKSFYNVSSGQASILISRGAPITGTEAVELMAIQIKVTSDTGDSKTVTINASQTALPKINEDKLYIINLGGLIGSSFKVEVAPVVEVNEKDRLCSMTKEHTLNYIGTPQTCLYTCCAGNEICIGTDHGTTSDCSTECCDGTCCIDGDDDGHGDESCGGDDCDDTNPGIHPGIPEICGNGIDEDCDDVDDPCAGTGNFYYVDNSGACDNGGPGNETEPWCDIDQAAGTMGPGDTVYVKAGTYSGFAITITGGENNYISYLAYPGDTVITGEMWFGDAVSYIKIDGFDVEQINMEGCNNYNIVSNNIVDQGGNMNFGGTGNIIEGNEFSYDTAHGLHHGGPCPGVNTIIRNNIIHDNGLHGWGAVGGINESVINNIVYNNGRVGIFYGTASPENILIEGNLVFNNDQNGEGYPEIYAKGPGAIVRGNTAYTISATASYVYHLIEASGVIAENNIGYRTGVGEVVAHIPTSAITDYNDWFNPDEPACIRRGWDTPVTLAEYQAYGQGANSISQDPLFVNLAGNDFHLQSTSPCIDAGDPTATNGVDLDNNPRIVNGIIDMGAYEYQGASAGPTCDETAASGSCEDVQASVDNVAATGGGVVCIPEGEFEFNCGVSMPGGISLIGAGKDKTILRSLTFRMFDINHDGDQGGSFRISGISFIGYDPISEYVSYSAIGLSNIVDFRIDNSHFEGFKYTIGVMSRSGYPQSRGVIDHCTIIRGNSTYSSPYGFDDQRVWEDDMKLGTAEAVFVEDCTIDLGSGASHPAASFDGGHYVFRHNVVTNSSQLDAHGPGYRGPRGARASEIYNNIIERSTSNVGWCAIGLRAGGGVIFNNTFRNWDHAVMFTIDSGSGDIYPGLDQIHDMWVWGNTLENIGDLIYLYNTKGMILEDRDYFLREPNQAQDGFIYTPYTYPHPLVSG